MELFLYGMREFFMILLPVAGVVALVYLALLFRKLIETLKELDKTLTIVNKEVEKLDAPLSTVEDLSHTVDEVHHASRKAVQDAVAASGEYVNKAKEWVSSVKDSSEDVQSTINEQIEKNVKPTVNNAVAQTKNVIDNLSSKTREVPVYHTEDLEENGDD